MWDNDVTKLRETATDLRECADELEKLGRPADKIAHIRSGADIAERRAAELEAFARRGLS